MNFPPLLAAPAYLALDAASVSEFRGRNRIWGLVCVYQAHAAGARDRDGGHDRSHPIISRRGRRLAPHSAPGIFTGSVFSVPLPRNLRMAEEKVLASAYDTIGTTSHRSNDKAIAKEHDRRLMYFVNATSKLQLIQNYPSPR